MTYKSHSLFRRILSTRRVQEDKNSNSKYETLGGVYYESVMLQNNNQQELMVIQEDNDSDDHWYPLQQEVPKFFETLEKKLPTLYDDGATISTGMETLSLNSNNSFDDSLEDSGSVCSYHSRGPTISIEWKRQHSQRDLFANMNDDEEAGNEESAIVYKWKSSGDSCHHDDAPLITLRSESIRLIDPRRPEFQLEDDEVLRKVLAGASKRLPRHTACFASLHVMINNERVKHQVAPLQRCNPLDDLAREHAAHMGRKQTLEHVDCQALQKSLTRCCNWNKHQQRIGCNVSCCTDGDLIRLHASMMKNSVADCNNVLDRRYSYMGVGTYKSLHDGKLYVCQLFF